jgi:hypothetical protein
MWDEVPLNAKKNARNVVAKANPKYNVEKHKILWMDRNRLVLCGLLSKEPQRSQVVKRINNPTNRKFTAAQRMHIVATHFTPELPRSWVYYQFERLGGDRVAAQRVFERIAYQEPAKSKYKFLAANNLQFIGHAETERYYLRRNPDKGVAHPSWVLPYFLDARKQGKTLRQIGETLELTDNQVKHVVYELCPRGIFRPNVKNPNPLQWGKRKS